MIQDIPKVNQSIITKVFPPRKPAAHKNDFGHLLVIGGSKLYTGSPILNALAAYKAGTDLVTIVAPKRTADTAAAFSPDLITYPVEGDFFTPAHLDKVFELIQGKTAVVIGSGIGRRRETLTFVQEILARQTLPIVIDADAIYGLVGQHSLVKEKKFVLTPHAYEFQILTEAIPPAGLEERIELVKKWSVELTSTILLKGSQDIISDGQETMINETGNPFMTVGGSGDTLAGIYGGLLAQGVDEFDAGCAAAFINGAAGDLAAAQLGPGMLATDLLNFIPQVIMETLIS